MTTEIKEKIRSTLLGRKKSPETIERLRISAICRWDGLPIPIWPKKKSLKNYCVPVMSLRRGHYVRTDETRQKNRLAILGRKIGPQSEETKLKRSMALRGRKKALGAGKDFKEGHSPWNKEQRGLQISTRCGIPQPQTRREKNPNWKGGISKYRNKVCCSGQYKNWRRLVLEKYSRICQKCGEKANTVHHLFNFVDYPDLRFDIENGVPLNSECHINFHNNYGWRHNTSTQIMEFLKGSNSVLTGETQIKMGMEI